MCIIYTQPTILKIIDLLFPFYFPEKVIFE